MAKRLTAKALAARVTARMSSDTVAMVHGLNPKAVPLHPTGIPSLDRATGGGLPIGRIIEVYGPQSAGKTTVALHCAAAHQSRGLIAFIDAEHALDPTYVKAVGVDMRSAVIVQPDCGEEALAAVDALLEGGCVFIVVDSVAALTPRAELADDYGTEDNKVKPALQARMMSQALRRITAISSRVGCTVMFVNQTRSAIGSYSGPVTPGGNALKFYTSQRFAVKRVSALKLGAREYGHRAQVTVVKNKIAIPGQRAEFDLVWGKGASYEAAVLEAAMDAGVAERAGAWFNFGEQTLGQGRLRAIEALEDDPALTALLVAATTEAQRE